jgi:acyl-CoA reductase-like NAD-dependent aldehyde dehydrogenase
MEDMLREQKFYLAGEWRASEVHTVIKSPYDGRELAKVSLATEQDVDEAIRQAVRAFAVTRKLASYERSRILRRLYDGVAARRDEIARVMVEESGKPIRQARQEVERGLCTLSLAAEEAKRVGGEVIPLDLLPGGPGVLGITRRVPIGPVLGIPAFNFPFNLVAHKIAPALAAGNPVILKPAPQTPLTSLLVAEIFATTEAPAGMLSVLPCRNEVAELMVADERIKMLTFTGSAEVGWRLKARCGKKKVLLELGGNAGAIIDEDADVAQAARRCTFAAFAYAGQVCVSLQRIYAHRSVYAGFVEELIAATERLRLGDPLDEATQVGPMISSEAAEACERLIQEAIEQGATPLIGGKRDGQFFTPTVLADVRPEMRICQEEAFAPVVTVSPFDDLDEAIRLVNLTPYGLQAGIFTGRIQNVMRAFEEIEAGGIVINDAPLYRADNGPFGGFKDSGLGREAVRETLGQMTETKLIILNCHPPATG